MKALPNEYRIEGDIAILTIRHRKHGALEVKIDSNRLREVICWRWYAIYEPVGKRFYAAHSVSNLQAANRRTTVYLHRFLCGSPSGVIDHRNGNGLDNTSANLRVTNQSINQLNRPRTGRKPKSGFRGVVFCGRRWKAAVHRYKKPIHLGLHDTPELAHKAVIAYLKSQDVVFPEATQ